MKKSLFFVLTLIITMAISTSCNSEPPKTVQAPVVTQAPSVAKAPVVSQPAASDYNGTVIETMNTGGYTYVQIDTGKEKLWAAAPEVQVKVGDKVSIPQGAPMKNYYSKTLDRTFDLVYFVGTIITAGSAQPNPVEKTTPAASAVTDFSQIKKPVNGKTIAEIFSQKDDLQGKKIILRGKAVKFSPEIMGKNWIHVQDGTGANGTNDLTITTDSTVAVGNTILVKGELILNKDFGSGYKYDVIIEDAEVTVE